MVRSTEPSLAVVVLNWNRRADSIECLDSIRGSTYSPHVVFVDNGSADGSAEAVHLRYPDVTLIQNSRNLGYTGGNNAGLRQALTGDPDYLLVLNNDTVVEPGFFQELVRYGEACRDVGAVTPKILRHDRPHTLWSAGYTFDVRRCIPQAHGWEEPDDGRYDEPADTAYAVGCALFMRREALNRVGLFDDRFFLVYEDTDWSFRLRKSGFKIRYLPTARVLHKGSASFTGTDSPLYRYYWTRNSLLFTRKHVRIPARWDTYRTILWRASAHTVHFLRQGTGEGRAVAQAIVRGVGDFALGRFGGRFDTR